jgi:hypothetical protein
MTWWFVALVFAGLAAAIEYAIRKQESNQRPASRVNRRTLDRINRTHPHGE